MKRKTIISLIIVALAILTYIAFKFVQNKKLEHQVKYEAEQYIKENKGIDCMPVLSKKENAICQELQSRNYPNITY